MRSPTQMAKVFVACVVISMRRQGAVRAVSGSAPPAHAPVPSVQVHERNMNEHLCGVPVRHPHVWRRFISGTLRVSRVSVSHNHVTLPMGLHRARILGRYRPTAQYRLSYLGLLQADRETGKGKGVRIPN